MEAPQCSSCNSTRLVVRQRQFTDVFNTWILYGFNFVLSGFGKDFRSGPTTTDELRFDWQAHRNLATARYFWRCDRCGETGAIFDEDVRSPEALSTSDQTYDQTPGGTWLPWIRKSGKRD